MAGKEVFTQKYGTFVPGQGGRDEEDTLLGLLYCVRCAKVHWGRFDEDVQDAIGSKVDCYEYFRLAYPTLVMHVYTCMQLHYRRLAAIHDDSFHATFRKYVASGFRGI